MFSALITRLKSPVFADSEQTRGARYLYYTLLITTLGIPIFMLVPLLFGHIDRWNLIICSSLFGIGIMLLWFIRRGHVRLASIIFIGSILISIIMGGLTANGIRSPGLLAIPSLLTVCSLLLGNRATLILGVLTMLSVTGLLFYGRSEASAVSALLLDIDYFFSASFVISVTVVILHFTINQMVHSGQQVRQQAQELAKLNAELQLEMNARIRTEKMLYQEQKLESIGLLVGGVAHDFNNLFTSMLGQASLAQRHLPPDHKAYRHLEKNIKTTQQAAELTRQLLAYTGQSNVQREPLDLNQLIEENQVLLDIAIPSDTVLTLELQPHLPMMQAARGQLQQVIMNLLINAAQAITQPGGRITVTTRTVTFTEAPEPFDFMGQAPAVGDYIRLTVQDNGSGMPQAILDRIFDPYFTTKENGHGLGLSAVLGIIQAHQGSLQVTSQPGQGSCFQIYFPIYQYPVIDEVVANSLVTRLVADATILVIDDQAEVRESAVEIFRSAGYRTLEAANGNDGITLFQQQQAQIGVVLLDVVMPGLSGVETLTQLRAIDPTAKVILTSGYSERTIFTQMQRQQPTDFLSKPYLRDTLLNRVATVLNL